MLDILDAEESIDERAGNYQPLATNTGLGVYERGDPWGSGYNLIDYHKINL